MHLHHELQRALAETKIDATIPLRARPEEDSTKHTGGSSHRLRRSSMPGSSAIAAPDGWGGGDHRGVPTVPPRGAG